MVTHTAFTAVNNDTTATSRALYQVQEALSAELARARPAVHTQHARCDVHSSASTGRGRTVCGLL